MKYFKNHIILRGHWGQKGRRGRTNLKSGIKGLNQTQNTKPNSTQQYHKIVERL
jgi:hypothetical protein